MEALSVHIVHRENVVQAALLREIRTKLHDEFGIDHLTIQMETSQAGNPHECFSSANCFEPAPNI
jgi:Co/Zn/Cd efflux system component